MINFIQSRTKITHGTLPLAKQLGCGGSSICKHNRIRSSCKSCGVQTRVLPGYTHPLEEPGTTAAGLTGGFDYARNQSPMIAGAHQSMEITYAMV